MRSRYYIATAVVCGFVAIVFAVAFFRNPFFPRYIIAGEESVGTWVSGTLLIMCATISLIFAMRRSWFPWLPITLFFFLLALDERFMFHENVKYNIIYQYKLSPTHPGFLSELPVLVGALVGLIVAIVLWTRLHKTGRVLLAGSVLFGTASVALDVLDLGVVWEDSFKVVAELMVACAFLSEV